jgi:dimethylargininase
VKSAGNIEKSENKIPGIQKNYCNICTGIDLKTDMFKKAIVRKPCPEMINGLTSASLGKPDYQGAMEQHGRYVEALRECGLEVNVLEADSRFPDSVFVEDVALCTPRCAIITNPGAPSRNEERELIKPVLGEYFDSIESIEWPGTLDAGDVMMVGKHFYIGNSERTNKEGAGQLIRILEKYGLTGSMVSLSKMLHLKSGVSYLEGGRLLVTGEFTDHPAFEGFQRIEVDPGESYAANSLWINSKVLVPAGFPNTLKKIEQAGYPAIVLDVSEFQKLDGGLSCLSLRF